jgi:hypothetical protein
MKWRRLIAVTALTVGVALFAASEASALTIRAGHYTLMKLGQFHPGKDPTLRGATGAFGQPTSADGTDTTCKVRWSGPRLRIDFSNFAGLDPCSPQGGRAQEVFIGSSPEWETAKHLEVGQRVKRLRHLYPNATRHGSKWWLKAAVSHLGRTHRYAVLAARTANGRVSGFTGWIGAAGE